MVVDAQLHYTTSRRLAGSVLTSGLCRSCSLPSYESTFVHSRAYFAYNASYNVQTEPRIYETLNKRVRVLVYCMRILHKHASRTVLQLYTTCTRAAVQEYSCAPIIVCRALREVRVFIRVRHEHVSSKVHITR